MASIEGFVLAGGKSSRMGCNKALLELGGKKLIDRSADLLAGFTDTVSIVGSLPANITARPIIADLKTAGEHRAALVGIYTALFHTRTEWSLIVACDLPFVTRELLHHIISKADSISPSVGAILCKQPDGRVQPLIGLYRRDLCIPIVSQRLSDGRLRLQEMAGEVNAHLIDFDQVRDLPHAKYFFWNLNTPEDHLLAVDLEAGFINSYEIKLSNPA